MADDLMVLYDYFQTRCTNDFNDRVILPHSDPFTTLDDAVFFLYDVRAK